MPRPEYYVYQPNALDNAGWFSRLTFLWMWRFFLRSYGRTISVHNLFLPPKTSLSETLTSRLDKQWKRQLKSPRPSLVCALFRMFGVHYAWLAVLALLMQCVAQVLEILCMQWMCDSLADLSRFANPATDPSQAALQARKLVYWSAAGLCIFQLLSVLLNHHYFFRTFKMGMDVRVACSGLMYRKCLRLHQSVLAHTGDAHVLTLLADDANRFDLAFVHLHFLFLGPLQIVVVLAILWPLFGVASAAAVLLLFLYIPFQALLGSAFSALRMQTAQYTDERIAKTLEYLRSMKVLKMHALEFRFAQLVDAAREQEVYMIRRSAMLKALNLGIYFISSKLVMHLMLVIYVLSGSENNLNASHVFAGLCFINQLRTCVTLYFPYAVSQGSEGLVALRRVQRFLLLAEQKDQTEQRPEVSKAQLNGCKPTNGTTSASKTMNDGIELKNHGDDFDGQSGYIGSNQLSSDDETAEITGKETSKVVIDALVKGSAERNNEECKESEGQNSDTQEEQEEEEFDENLDQVSPTDVSSEERVEISSKPKSLPPPNQSDLFEIEVVAERYSASWCGNPRSNCLKELTFSVRGPQLVAVIGDGKSLQSLLHAMLSELCCTGGYMRVKGQISYCSQQSWLFAGTVRENITFGKPFNLNRYKRVISVCGLKRDLEQLPHGDRTYVGERAEQLSGGQRARVCLARAIYHESNVYLLDDPLSNVDVAVAKHIFDRCIRRHLADKLVFLVTHQLQFLKAADQILLLKEGRLVCAGDYTTLLRQKGEFFFFQTATLPSMIGPSTVPVVPSTMSYDMSTGESVPNPAPCCSNINVSNISSSIGINASSVASTSVFGTDNIDYPDLDQQSLCGGEQSTPGTPQLSRIGRRVSMRRQSSRLSEILPFCMDNSYEEEDPAERSFEREALANTGSTWWWAPTTNSTNNAAHPRRWSAGHWIYLRSGARCNSLLCLVVVGFICAQLLYTGSDYWLCCWAELQNNQKPSFNHTLEYGLSWMLADQPGDNLLIYAFLILAVCVFSLWRTLAFFVWCMRTSVHLHRRLFASLSRSPMSFFDHSPIGLLLNRCSRDMAIIDDMLPATIYDALGIICMNVACVLLICFLQYRMTIASVILFVLFALLIRLYLPSARQVRHLEAATRSPLYSYLCASLQGLVTIRALKTQPTFISLYHARQDCHSAAWFAFLASSRWFGVQLDWLCSLFIGAVALSSALQLDPTQAGLVALALTSAINLTADFQWGMRQLAEASSQLGAVQRLDQFSHLPDEQPPINANAVSLPTDWPNEGEIEFVRVSVEYPRLQTGETSIQANNNQTNSTRLESKDSVRGQFHAVGSFHGSPRTVSGRPSASVNRCTGDGSCGNVGPAPIIALRCISFCIRANEKVSIVGRTGAGKSSLIASLFRMVDIKGSIFIDHVDTRSIPLRLLRQSISIIPQEPLLFSDTLRMNLDPFGQYDDQQLWQALERVQLKQLVDELPQGLDTALHEAGDSFSVGQKQLICLARSILKKNKILVLDEASSNVDARTDALIQQTIRNEFGNCTVLTVAHRLNSVMDSDRILVLDNGRVVEFDIPAILLRNEMGMFSAMVAATGRETSRKLRLIASQKLIQTANL